MTCVARLKPGRFAFAFGLGTVLSAGLAGAPRAFSQTSAPSPITSRARYVEGIAHFKAGRLADARPCFDEVAARASGYLQLCATHMTGMVHRIEGRPAEASAAFDQVVTQARAILSAHDASSAVARHADVLARLALIYQAEIDEQQRNWAEAARHYEVFLKEYDGDFTSPASVIGPNPALYEKLARIYWRLERYDEAAETFARLLERWPDASRAPIVEMALLALKVAPPCVRSQKLAFLACSLSWPLELQIGDVAAMEVSLSVPEGLGHPAEPIRRQLQDLTARCAGDSREILLIAMHMGWLAFEAGRMGEAEAVFARLGRAARAREDVFSQRLYGYAELSRGLALARQEKLEEALAAAKPFADPDSRCHLGRLAFTLVHSFQNYRDYIKATQKSGVENLQ